MHKAHLTATFTQDKKNYLLSYSSNDTKDSIALSLPNTQKIYLWEYEFPPFLESFLPEGYLYEIFKNLLTKEYGYIDDYLIFSLLADSIDSRVNFKSTHQSLKFDSIDLDEILNNDTDDTFSFLVDKFLTKNAIGGVQPKSIAIIKDKDKLNLKEVIVKTWGDEFANLAENEYFCLKACEYANIPIPKIHLSQNKNFLVVEKFIYKESEILGFEEVASLMNKGKNKKYSGSYEQIAKVIYPFLSDKKTSMINYYKTVVMNYLLKNGDAHLKNFGLLFRDDFSQIWLSPSYDIVSSVVYIFKDKPALNMFGKKVWYSKKELIEFGVKSCLLSKSEATRYYNECFEAKEQIKLDIKSYITTNPSFNKIGNRMVDILELDDTKTIKELDSELIRSWS